MASQLGLFDTFFDPFNPRTPFRAVPPLPPLCTAAPVPMSEASAPEIPTVDQGDQRTVEQARAEIQVAAHVGAFCPCCDQLVKIYKRKLNANMALFLCSLVVESARAGGAGWVSFKSCQFTSRDYPGVAMWGLAETCSPSDPDAQKFSGFWRPTKKGVAFAHGKVSVPSHAHVYNGEVIGWSDASVRIGDVADEQFNYAELMQSVVHDGPDAALRP